MKRRPKPYCEMKIEVIVWEVDCVYMRSNLKQTGLSLRYCWGLFRHFRRRHVRKLVIATLSLTMGLFYCMVTFLNITLSRKQAFIHLRLQSFSHGNTEKQETPFALRVISLPSRKNTVDIKRISFVIYLSSGDRKLRYGGGVLVCSAGNIMFAMTAFEEAD